MINPSKISKEWLLATAKENDADVSLVEKVIHALLLLEGLVEEDIPFIFKGGTALMLHDGTTKRLSVDIDISMQSKPDDFEEKLKNIVAQKGFEKVEFQERNTTSALQKEHYKFLYPSKINDRLEPILLDIVYEESPYENMEELDIDSPLVLQEGEPLKVKVPSKEDLLGDKLTAFAPNTTGIPYERSGNSMTMEIAKQLFDIGNLFDEIEEIKPTSTVYNRIAEKQLAYRELTDLNVNDALQDTIQTALCIISRGVIGHGNFQELQNGIKAVGNYIHSENYRIEQAIISAAKVAYLTALIEAEDKTVLRFTNPQEMKDWTIENQDYNKLNKMKKSNPEAFFYVYQMLTLKNQVL